jgi:lipid A 3-O-deacylase
MNNKIFAAAAPLLLCSLLVCSSPARAVDGLSIEGGIGQGKTSVVRVGATWNWDKKWFAQNRWQLGGYWEVQAGGWDNRSGVGALLDLSVTPVFRLAAADSPWYFEGAIGFHWLSDYPSRGGPGFSSKFQFGDHVGAGMRYGARKEHDIGLRVQHLSNGGIKNPNPGINLLLVRYQYHY